MRVGSVSRDCFALHTSLPSARNDGPYYSCTHEKLKQNKARHCEGVSAGFSVSNPWQSRSYEMLSLEKR